MRKVVTLSMGLVARLLSTLCEWYGEWLIRKLLGEEWEFEHGHGFWRDLWSFAEWLVDVIAQRWCQSSRHQEQW
jgi:hypothetical protein